MFKLIKEKIKENKITTIFIVILIIIITILQTKLTFNETKVKNLNGEITKLKEEVNIKSEKNTTVTKEINETENTTYFEKLKQRFIEIGKTKNKVYDDSLNGTVINKISWVDGFDITDGQIENLLNSLSGEKFKIKFSQTKNSKLNSYKIELIE
ncbi:hypothetical protein [Clostridium perfringens]|uniref:hypothetical protein n=1 Tax=Clostridium perfringens TaxID=1502 RepID=UPI00375461E5